MKTTTLLLSGLIVLGCTDLSAQAKKAAANFAGKWDVTASVNEYDTNTSSLTVIKKDGKWSASMVGEDGEKRDLTRTKADGKSLIIEFDMEANGQRGVIGAKAALNKDGALVGKWYARDDSGNELMTNDWKAVRSASSVLAGSWNVVAVTDDNDLEHQMIIKKSGSNFSGYASSDDGQLDYDKVTASKNVVKLELPYGGGTVKVEAKLKQARKLVGQWKYFDEFKDEVASGDWSASKQKRQKKAE